MGSSQKESKAEINIVLSDTIFLPGDEIKGKINILPKNKNDTNKFKDPKIIFSIIQKRNWQCFLYSQKQKSSLNGESNINSFSSKTNTYSEFKDKNISEGIQIPFTYIIPKDITPSLEWPHKKHEFAYIRNFFCVKIPELDYENQILIIIQKPPIPNQKPIIESVEEERNKFIFFNKGRIRIEASCQKSSYAVLSIIPLTVMVDATQSSITIKEVTVKLKRKLEFNYLNKPKNKKKFLQVMYYETKKVGDTKENILFNIPFKDGNDIEYYFANSTFKKNSEICCLLPDTDTDTINVSYYFKIIGILNDAFAKNIELKLFVAFHSKDEKKPNEKVYRNFSRKVTMINEKQIKIDINEPYLYYYNNPNNLNNNQQMSNYNNMNNITNNMNNNFISNNMNNCYNNTMNNNFNSNSINNNININNMNNSFNNNNINYNFNNNMNNDFNINNINNNFNSNNMNNDFNINNINNINNTSNIINNMNYNKDNSNDNVNEIKDLPLPPEEEIDFPSRTEVEKRPLFQ